MGRVYGRRQGQRDRHEGGGVMGDGGEVFQRTINEKLKNKEALTKCYKPHWFKSILRKIVLLDIILYNFHIPKHFQVHLHFTDGIFDFFYDYTVYYNQLSLIAIISVFHHFLKTISRSILIGTHAHGTDWKMCLLYMIFCTLNPALLHLLT